MTINAAFGAEGDGVGSNGFIVINGGRVSVNNIRVPDNPFDSEMGVLYRGGEVIIDGTSLQLEKGDQGNSLGGQAFGPGGQGGFPGGNGQGGFRPDQGGQHTGPQGQNFDMKEFKKKVSELSDDATLEDVLELLGMGGGFPGGNGQFPGGQDFGPGGQGGFPGGAAPGMPGETGAEKQ